MLRRIFFLLIAQVSVCLASPQTINFVLDLDGLLLDHIPPNHSFPLYSMQPDFEYEGHAYRFRKGAGEFVYSLSLIPNSRLSVFSAGSEGRNALALRNLKLPDGRNALNLTTGRIFSREKLVATSSFAMKRTHASWGEWLDVVPSATSHVAGFDSPHTLKKMLSRVLPDAWMSKTFLFDSTQRVAASGEEKNWVDGSDSIMLGYIHRELFDKPEIVNHKTHLELLQDFNNTQDPTIGRILAENYFVNDYKLTRLRGLIERALEYAKSERVSPREAMWRLQQQLVQLRVTEGPVATDLQNLEYFRIGFEKFRELNPNFLPITVCGKILGE